MNSSKVTDKIFDFSKVLVGRWKGGLGHVNVIASPDIFRNDRFRGGRCIGTWNHGNSRPCEGGI